MSRGEDTYRPPYAKANGRFPRRSVFVGTTNSDAYLKHDPSGYRRYWPVKCLRVDLDALRRDAPQLWAEAVARYNRGEQWWLTDDEAQLAEEQAASRSEDAGGPDQMILEWLLRLPADKRRELTSDEVAKDAMQLMAGQITSRTRQEIGAAMRRLGFKRIQRRIAGVQTWVYLAPDSILAAPVTKPGEKPAAVTVVEGGKKPA